MGELAERWFPLYWRDLLDATETWTDEELGAYIRLLIHQWRAGHIPEDPARIEIMLRNSNMSGVWPLLEEKFPVVEPGKRANRRMAEERQRAVERRTRRQASGRAAARRRWSGDRSPIANGNGSPTATDNSPPTSPARRRRHATTKEEKSPAETSGSKSDRGAGRSRLPDGSPNRSPKRRARFCPDGWEPGQRIYDWIQRTFSVDEESARAWVAAELPRFRDHEFGTPKSDWDRVLLNWLRTSADGGRGPKQSIESDAAWRGLVRFGESMGVTWRAGETREQFRERVNEANRRRQEAVERRNRERIEELNRQAATELRSPDRLKRGD